MKYPQHIVDAVRDLQPRARTDTTNRLRDIHPSSYCVAITGQEGPWIRCGDERTPSLRIYNDGWYCYAHGTGGGIYQLAQHAWGYHTCRGQDFLAIQQQLADIYG